MNIISLSQYSSIIFRGVTLLLIAHRSKKSLTKNGIIAALITGFIHSLPPSNLYLILIITFYLTSSKATKYKQNIKSTKTKVPENQKPLSNSHSQRTHVQVLSNSIVATILILVSTLTHNERILKILKIGIIGQYVAVQADTCSSELGMLSNSYPFLITTFETVPTGTNGGVTNTGLIAGLIGSSLISFISCFTFNKNKFSHFIYFTIIGLIGTLIDSILGALLQTSMIDRKNGLILEPIGGVKIDNEILIKDIKNLKKISGDNVLSNNQVNISMAALTSLLSMALYGLFF